MRISAAGTDAVSALPVTAGAALAQPPRGTGPGQARPTRPITAHTLARQRRSSGFTLLELLIVVAIMAIATAGVALSLRSGSATALEREAQRLAVLLESARAQSRMTANPVRWQPTATGFSFEGLADPASLPSGWLGQDVQAAGAGTVLLGPEPVIGPQQIRLVSVSEPTRSLLVATDGVRPFSVQAN